MRVAPVTKFVPARSVMGTDVELTPVEGVILLIVGIAALAVPKRSRRTAIPWQKDIRE
jgi:hypothetical protein